MGASWRVLIVGYGVQGEKRRRFAGADCIGVVDPERPEADWPDLAAAPLNAYDAAILCTPDAPKAALLDHLIEHGKHVLVEKPLWAPNSGDIARLDAAARRRGVAVRTAYNHRFEPHLAEMADLVRAGELGRLYRCRLFYGNGTARLVRDSVWRDGGSGVLHDLGSHLLDLADFWFGATPTAQLISADRFENRAPDHAVIAGRIDLLSFEAEMSLISWRNSFSAEIWGETRLGACRGPLQMGAEPADAAAARVAERATAGGDAHADPGGSDLGARIRRFPPLRAGGFGGTGGDGSAPRHCDPYGARAARRRR